MGGTSDLEASITQSESRGNPLGRKQGADCSGGCGHVSKRKPFFLGSAFFCEGGRHRWLKVGCRLREEPRGHV